MIKTLVLSAVCLIAAASSAQAVDSGDPEAGERVFEQRCAACHTVDPAVSRPTGPHLFDIYGRPAAAVDDFRYSRAMTESGLVWDTATLDTYLEAPMRALRGTSMAFALPHPQQRADVIAYLRQFSQE